MKCDNCGAIFKIVEATKVDPQFTLKPTNGDRPSDRKVWEEAFDSHFWPVYPRKIAKKDAMKAWRAQMPKNRNDYAARFDSIMRLLEQRKAKEWADREAHNYPYPATFLRGEEF